MDAGIRDIHWTDWTERFANIALARLLITKFCTVKLELSYDCRTLILTDIGRPCKALQWQYPRIGGDVAVNHGQKVLTAMTFH